MFGAPPWTVCGAGLTRETTFSTDHEADGEERRRVASTGAQIRLVPVYILLAVSAIHENVQCGRSFSLRHTWRHPITLPSDTGSCNPQRACSKAVKGNVHPAPGCLSSPCAGIFRSGDHRDREFLFLWKNANVLHPSYIRRFASRPVRRRDLLLAWTGKG